MSIIRFKRYTNPRALRRVRLELLREFFGRYESELAATGHGLPATSLDPQEYCDAIAALLMSPEQLPDGLIEALHAIDEMSSPRGRERLEWALAEQAPGLLSREDLSPMEMALDMWLRAPELLAATHNRVRLTRLSAFEHYTGAGTAAGGGGTAEDRPDGERLKWLSDSLDAWFASHHRGEHTTRVEPYLIEGERWHLVRHGDAFSRTPKVEEWRTEIIHFRPEKDDVVVYSPELDEIRINARTRGEREAYRQHFGLFLKGDRAYFSGGRTYTLDPLRTEGADALDTEGVEGILRVTLKEVEVAVDNAYNEVFTLQADDLFAHAAMTRREAIPNTGRLRRAAFEFHFADSNRPRAVEIRLPNVLKVGRHADPLLVNRFLSRRGFRAVRGCRLA